MAGLQEEYRRLALPFELVPSRVHAIYKWQPPHSTTEELIWGSGTAQPLDQSPGRPAPQRHE